METVAISRVLVLILYAKLCQSLEVRNLKFPIRPAVMKNCKEQAKQPFFDIDLIVGKPWRIYYTWNMVMDNKCMDMIVKNATPPIVNRIYNDMHEYLETQPVWDAATLLITMGTAKHELLMFADQGEAGNFVAVPNVVRDGNITPMTRAVPLLKFFMKLVHEGKYLLVMDCHIGVASLLSREMSPYQLEVASVARSLNLGEGTHACLSDKRQDEVSIN